MIFSITLPCFWIGSIPVSTIQLDSECDAQGCFSIGSDETGTGKPLDCQTYVAPSTLGDHSNMGIYTGVDLKTDEIVNWPEISIPLLFRGWYDHVEGYTDGELWERYIWEGHAVGIETYNEIDLHDSKAVFVPGVGCTVNGAIDMRNIHSAHDAKYDTAGLHRSRDPGSGAFSGYYSAIVSAAENVSAGAELFADYGSEWIPDIPEAQVTIDSQMDRADDFLVDEYIPFVSKHKDELSDELKQALWNFAARDFPVRNQVMSNLPRFSWDEVEQFVHEHMSDLESISISRHFFRKRHTRTLEWLQTHPNSYCQDHLYPEKSTLPQAGRGAFATRHLPAGTVVAYSPLIHMGKDGRAVFHVQYFDPGRHRHTFDLIINYSFGHPNSTMILTPYGGMVNFINHAPRGKANVKIRFPDKELVAHKPDWLNRGPDFFYNTREKIGLSFEYVALRDIKEGEEVFMDYGPAWEKAWEEHIRRWEPLQDSENYVHSSQWREPFLRTRAELKTNPYPPNLHTMCISSYMNKDGELFFVQPFAKSSKRSYCDVMERRGNATAGYIYDIFLRLAGEDDHDSMGEGESSWVFVKDVKASAVSLTDHSFTTDWHLPNAFRHYIQIPDEIMPKAWQNGPDPFKMPEDEKVTW